MVGGSLDQKLKRKIEKSGALLWVPSPPRPVHSCIARKITIRTMTSRKQMKTAKNTEIEIHEKNGKNAIWTQLVAKKSNWGPRSRLKMKMKAGRMVFPTHYCTLVSEKIALILPQKVIQSRIFADFFFCKIRPWTRSDLGIGCIVAFSVRILCLHHLENHYSNREVDELDYGWLWVVNGFW